MASTAALREQLARAGITPATLALAEAAAFVGLSPNTFLAEVAAGTYPPPLPLKCRRRLWSRAALARACGAGQDGALAAEDAINEAIDRYAV